MSHIVIHESQEGVTQYCQFDELGNAVTYLEELQNASGIESAKLFALEEVMFEVKQYYKVEVVDALPALPIGSLQPPEILPVAEDVSYVEAAMQPPIETMGAETDNPEIAEPALASAGFDESLDDALAVGGESRRGLFGR